MKKIKKIISKKKTKLTQKRSQRFEKRRPTKNQIPTRRQAMSSPSLKPSPQKIRTRVRKMNGT